MAAGAAGGRWRRWRPELGIHMHDWSTKENVAQAGRRERRIQCAAAVCGAEEPRRLFSGILVDEPLKDGDLNGDLDDGIFTGADFEM